MRYSLLFFDFAKKRIPSGTPTCDLSMTKMAAVKWNFRSNTQAFSNLTATKYLSKLKNKQFYEWLCLLLNHESENARVFIACITDDHVTKFREIPSKHRTVG